MMELSEAKAWLRARLDDGAPCPCCTQYAKRYHRKINSGMARLLIMQWCKVGQEFAHTASLCPNLREGAKLAYWGLMEHDDRPRDDGGKSGWWRITDAGVRFVLGRESVPKYVYVYDDRVMGFDAAQMVSIQDALGTKFSYSDLMGGM